jgi:hypothetical protein
MIVDDDFGRTWREADENPQPGPYEPSILFMGLTTL